MLENLLGINLAEMERQTQLFLVQQREILDRIQHIEELLAARDDAAQQNRGNLVI